jgi:hypothetical protein
MHEQHDRECLSCQTIFYFPWPDLGSLLGDPSISAITSEADAVPFGACSCTLRSFGNIVFPDVIAQKKSYLKVLSAERDV